MFDPTKPVRQKNGRKAEIIRRGLKNPDYPLVVVYEGSDGCEYVDAYAYNGTVHNLYPDSRDLENISEDIEGYVNFYDDGRPSMVYPIEELAIKHRDTERKCLGCIHIKFMVGEGL